MRAPRDYQLDAIKAVKDAFLAGKKGVTIEAATGLGKGLIIASIAKAVLEKGGRVLVAVNRDNLVTQLVEGMYEQGLFPSVERGVDKASPMANCVVASIQTAQGKRLQKWNPEHFKLVITDEVHGSASKTFKQTLGHFKSTYHLGVTATLERHDKAGLFSGYEENVWSMPLDKGISEGWLVPLDIEQLPVPIVIDDQLATKKVFTEEDEANVFRADTYLPRLFHEAAIRSRSHKSLFFWANCDSSKEAAAAFVANGIDARHSDGYMSKTELEENLAWFKEPGPKALMNADLYSVGFDAPFITLVGIMRISRSIPMLKQRLGRGTRPLCVVDGLQDAETRRMAIAMSTKPTCKVLDLCLQIGEDVKSKFATPTALITDDPEEQKWLEKERKKGSGSFTMEELATKLRVKRTTDRDAQLAKQAEMAANAAEKHRNKTEVYIADILNTSDDSEEASPKQRGFLRHLGMADAYKTKLTKRQASRIIGRYQTHSKKFQIA